MPDSRTTRPRCLKPLGLSSTNRRLYCQLGTALGVCRVHGFRPAAAAELRSAR